MRTIWDEMLRMQEEMDSLFGNYPIRNPSQQQALISGPASTVAQYRKPVADIYETEKEYVAELEMPGVDKKDIKIHVSEDAMEIKVEKKEEKEEKKKDSYRYQRNYTGFYRCFALPENADSNKVEAIFKNGILELKIPKNAVKEQKLKMIEVK
jgi:HSP20 family protein